MATRASYVKVCHNYTHTRDDDWRCQTSIRPLSSTGTIGAMPRNSLVPTTPGSPWPIVSIPADRTARVLCGREFNRLVSMIYRR
jgi:hypothetical protein